MTSTTWNEALRALQACPDDARSTLADLPDAYNAGKEPDYFSDLVENDVLQREDGAAKERRYELTRLGEQALNVFKAIDALTHKNIGEELSRLRDTNGTESKRYAKLRERT